MHNHQISHHILLTDVCMRLMRCVHFLMPFYPNNFCNNDYELCIKYYTVEDCSLDIRRLSLSGNYLFALPQVPFVDCGLNDT